MPDLSNFLLVHWYLSIPNIVILLFLYHQAYGTKQHEETTKKRRDR